MSLPRVVAFDVAECPRCGREHEDLTFTRLMRPAGDYTHWAECPLAGEPILAKFIPREDAN